VPVSLQGAHVEPRQVFHDVFRNADERGFLQKLFDFDSRTGRYREVEKAIAVGDQLFVVGAAELDEARGMPYLTGALVSTRSEESRTTGLGIGVWLLVLLAVVGAGLGSAFALAHHGGGPQPGGWLPGLGVAALLLLVAWSVTTYNRLRLLAQGVGRATALIDVQLKRRHDLVPALARVVAAHADHERSLLEALTAERSPGTSGASGTDAAEQTAELRQVLAVAEAYPELTADQSFLNLQRQLADTEARIAGSRTFYDDTVTLLRNRSGRFPGALVARFVPHTRSDLVVAQGFERTVPAQVHAFS
jgi:LemA protein